MNYMGNAVKFTDEGSVSVRVTVVEDAADSAVIRFAVHDTGVGIPADKIAGLFQPFVQADNSTTRKYGGTGLGLAIAKRMSGAMGGDVGVESEVGKGSTFWFTVRLAKAPLTEAAVELVPESGTTGEVNFTGRRVLLVDDDEFNREIGIILLQDLGLLVEEAKNGIEAVEMAAANTYDLILMDMQMPRMDGLEATRAIRATPTGGSIAIIAMTANAFEEDRKRCLAAGMNDFVTKPVDPLKLQEALARQLSQQASA